MAYLEDIPKYAFGTTHEIVTYCPDTSGESSSDDAPSSTSRSTSTGVSEGSSSTSGYGSHGIDLSAFKQESKSSKISETKFKELVLHAVQLGCRHFDCAPLYKTQPYVGVALREAMNSVPRQKIFITSKLPPNMMQPDNIMRSISKSIQELQCNYLDLFLIHAPFSTKHVSDDDFYPIDEDGNLMLDEEEQLLENAWRKLVDLKRKGYTRYIGLSNVNLEQLIRLNNIHHIDVVQNEYHIYNQDREILDYCEEIDVHFEGYAAMGNPKKAQRDNKPCVALDPVVQRVARENRLSIAEVNIQWVCQQPLSYVIRCETPKELEENLAATKCISLPVNDLIDLDSLNRDVRLYLFDEHEGITKHREYPFKKFIADSSERSSECSYQQRVQQHLMRQQRQHNRSNNNNDNDLSSSDCSDISGDKISTLSNLKTSSSQSDSSITTTIARSSTPSSITDVACESPTTASTSAAPTSDVKDPSPQEP